MTTHRIRLWDLPTRIFHWSLVLLVTASVISAKIGGNMMAWHERSGLAIIGLLTFRLVWGFVGSTYARFAHFVRGPRTIIAFLRGQWHGVGHNPLGALSVLAMLALLLAQALSGLFANDDIAFNGPLYALVSKAESNALTSWHHRAEYALYALVGLHVATVALYTWWKKESLVPPMVTGTKKVNRAEFRSAAGGGIVALTFALAISGTAVWAANGGFVPPPPPPVTTPAW